MGDDRAAEHSDRLAIEHLLRRYLFAADTRDIDSVVSCFTADAVLTYMDGAIVMRGHRDIRVAFTERRGVADLGFDDIVGMTHVSGSADVDVAGDSARATSLAVAFLVGSVAGLTVLVQRGVRYDDVLARLDGDWLIAERRHRGLWHHVSESSGGRPKSPPA